MGQIRLLWPSLTQVQIQHESEDHARLSTPSTRQPFDQVRSSSDVVHNRSDLASQNSFASAQLLPSVLLQSRVDATPANEQHWMNIVFLCSL